MNVKKIFFDAPAEFFLKLLDDGERDVGFNSIMYIALARQYLTTGKSLEDCKSDLGLYITIPDNAIELGLEILSKKYEDTWIFGIERKVFIDFYLGYKSKEDIVYQIAYMALVCMIGRDRTYCRFSNQWWLHSMSGHKKCAGDLHPVIKRYDDPRRLRALKEILSSRYNIHFSTKKTRGTMVSKVLSSEELDAILVKSKITSDETASKGKSSQNSEADTGKNEETAAKQKEQPLWRTDFNEYKRLFEEAKRTVLADAEWRKKQEDYHQNIDYDKSIQKMCDYWISEDGWKKCKSSKSQNFDPVKRLHNAFDFSMNRIYKSLYSGNNKPQEYRRRSGQYDSTDMEDWNNGKI